MSDYAALTLRVYLLACQQMICLCSYTNLGVSTADVACDTLHQRVTVSCLN